MTLQTIQQWHRQSWCRTHKKHHILAHENVVDKFIFILSLMLFPTFRQLPNESKLFSGVDKAWKDIMRRTEDRPNALRSATAPGVLEMLQSANASLEKIQKCLEVMLSYSLGMECELNFVAHYEDFEGMLSYIFFFFSKELILHPTCLNIIIFFAGLPGDEASGIPTVLLPQ